MEQTLLLNIYDTNDAIKQGRMPAMKKNNNSKRETIAHSLFIVEMRSIAEKSLQTEYDFRSASKLE